MHQKSKQLMYLLCILAHLAGYTFAYVYHDEESCTIHCRVVTAETKKDIDNHSILLTSPTGDITMHCDTPPCTFNLMPGEILISTTAPGFDTATMSLSLHPGSDTLIVVELQSIVPELPRVTVTPDQSIHHTFVTPKSTFKPHELLSTAGTGNDLNRVLALHSSATTMNITDNNSLFIRGGGVQENVYYIDGIEVNTINHYATKLSSGAMGFITADLVNRIRVNTIMQPRFPPRNSSVIELYLKEVPEKKRSSQLDLNISGLSLQLQARSNDHSRSYLTNVRAFDMKPLEKFTNGIWSQYGDAVLKGTVILNGDHTIGSTSIISYDKTRSKTIWDEDCPDADYQIEVLQICSGIYSTLHKGNFSNRLTLSFGFLKDEYVQKTTTFIFDEKPSVTAPWIQFQSSDQRMHLLLNEQLTFNIDNVVIETGTRIKGIDYTISKSGNGGYWIATIPVGYETGGFLQGQIVSDKLKLIAGARCDYISSTEDWGIAPYLGIGITTERYGGLTLQSTYSYQETPIFQKNYAWLDIKKYPVDDFVLQRCWQSSLLYELSIRKNHAFSAEPFFKFYNQEYPYNRPYNTVCCAGKVYNPDGSVIPRRITEANGKKFVTGLELSLHTIKEGLFRYRLGITLAKAKNRFTNGIWYNDENDIRAQIKLMLGARLSNHHDLSFTCLAAEGRPYSSIDPETIDPPSLWFARRFDPTIFLSARYTFTYPGEKVRFGAYIDVQNILNQTHAIAMQEVSQNQRKKREMQGILPTAGLTLAF